MSLQIINGIQHYSSFEAKTIATIGTFDGVHLGHQAILRHLKLAAERQGATPLAITFEPHPRVLVTPGSAPLLLTVWEEKMKLFEKYMEGRLLVLEFNEALMNMTAEEFTREILLDRIKVQKLIVGYDHAFGKNRSGTINDLVGLSRKYSFALEIVDPVIVEGKPISSSRIRRLILENDLSRAIDMLGHHYPIRGKVIRGIGLGREIGFPTANLRVPERKLLPADGVYSCGLELAGRKFDGMMFIGQNYFNPDAGISIEVNIFDFDENLYDKELFCYPETFLRENKKYDSTTQLVEQIKIDKEIVLRIKNEGEKRNVG